MTREVSVQDQCKSFLLHLHVGSENRPECNAVRRPDLVYSHFFLHSLNFHTFVLTTTTTLHLHAHKPAMYQRESHTVVVHDLSLTYEHIVRILLHYVSFCFPCFTPHTSPE